MRIIDSPKTNPAIINQKLSYRTSLSSIKAQVQFFVTRNGAYVFLDEVSLLFGNKHAKSMYRLLDRAGINYRNLPTMLARKSGGKRASHRHILDDNQLSRLRNYVSAAKSIHRRKRVDAVLGELINQLVRVQCMDANKPKPSTWVMGASEPDTAFRTGRSDAEQETRNQVRAYSAPGIPPRADDPSSTIANLNMAALATALIKSAERPIRSLIRAELSQMIQDGDTPEGCTPVRGIFMK